jgi:hypothetical protein
MGDYQPVYTGGAKPSTATTSAAVTGGQLLMVSGSGTVGVATEAGGATAVGVAAHDAPSGGKVAMWPLAGVVHELAAPAAITAGAGIIAEDAGTVQTATIATAAAAGTLIGIALTTAASNKVRFVGRG